MEALERVCIISPHTLVVNELKHIILAEFPGLQIATHTHWVKGCIDYSNKHLRLLIIDTAQAFFVPRVMSSVRRKMPRVTVVGLQVSETGRHKNAQFDDIISSTMSTESVLEIVRSLLAVSEEHLSMPQITHREMEVLQLLATGKSAREIANVLSISQHTVTSHRKNLSAKLGIKSISGMAIYAVSLGLVEGLDLEDTDEDDDE